MRQTVLLLLFAASGCAETNAPVTPGVKLDPRAGDECRAHCETLGMTLDAVVVIANSTGCVCTPRERSSSRERGSAAASAVAVAVQVREEAARQREAEAELQRQKLYEHEAAPPPAR